MLNYSIGGNGIYARFVKEAFPNLTISVLEMPKVVELAISLDENKTGNINFISGWSEIIKSNIMILLIGIDYIRNYQYCIRNI